MKYIHSLILASAAIATFGAFASSASAADYYSTTVVRGAPVVTNQTVQQSYTAVGTRKVGIVGSRPYPIEAASMQSRTVKTSNNGLAAQTEVTTTTNTSADPVRFTTGGGTYYTEDGAAYYADPALNINVRATGAFNN